MNGRAQPGASPFRLAVVGIWAILAVAAFALATGVVLWWLSDVARIGFPWAANGWQEGAYLLALARVAHGDPAYTLPRDVASSAGGPGYLLMLMALAAAVRLPVSIVAYRSVSAAIELLSIVPLSIVALLFARAAGLRLSRLRTVVVLAATVILSFAVLLGTPAFAALGSHALLALLVALALACYFAIALRALSGRAVWLLAAICTAAVFVDQRTILLLPVLAASLGATRRVSWLVAFASIAGMLALVGVAIATMPPEWRAWAFSLPAAHVWTHSTPFRTWQFLAQVGGDPFLAFEAVAFALVMVIMTRSLGRASYIIHGVAAAVVALITIVCYYGALTSWADFALAELFFVPYCATLAGLIATPRFVKRSSAALIIASAATVAGLAFTQIAAPKPSAANPQTVAQMSTGLETLRRLCTRQTVLITVLPDVLVDCPSAVFALSPSFVTLSAARRHFNAGLSAFDRPAGYAYIVDVSGMEIPISWQHRLHIDREIPVAIGKGEGYDDVDVRIWSSRGT